MTAKPSLLFIETNVGGPDPGMHSLLQVGLGVELGDGRRALDAFLVREPDIRIDPRAARIHGITAYGCDQQGIEPRAAARRILDFMSEHLAPAGASLCGWNIGIDRAFIMRLFKLAGEGDWLMHFERLLGFRSLDLQSALRFMSIQGLATPFEDFAEACERYGVLNERPHDAASDVVACMDLLGGMRASLPAGNKDGALKARLAAVESAEQEGATAIKFCIRSEHAKGILPLLGRDVQISIHEGEGS